MKKRSTVMMPFALVATSSSACPLSASILATVPCRATGGAVQVSAELRDTNACGGKSALHTLRKDRQWPTGRGTEQKA